MNRRVFMLGLLATTAAVSVGKLPLPDDPQPVVWSYIDLSSVEEYMLQFVVARTKELADELWSDQLIYGCYATRTTTEFPFIERIDPMEFLDHTTMVSLNA